VSERHGAIAWTADGWTLTDVGSSNGTLVNGERLEPNGGQCGIVCNLRCIFTVGYGAAMGLQAQLVAAVFAGTAKVLKDGDIVQFGTDTKVRVEVSARGCCRGGWRVHIAVM
jgi:pSer/pThr/pTyr-binding forkhead associated (FHA) protein